MFSRCLAVATSLLAIPLVACGGATLSGGTGEPTEDAGTPTHPTPTPGSSSGSGTSGGGPACLTDSDCSTGQACAWSTGVDWCAADDTGQGTCVTLVNLACQLETIETGCDCSGNEVTWPGGCSGLPSGYAPEQLAHAGACTGPVPTPAPAHDAGAPAAACSTSGDCPTAQFCGYPLGDCGSTAQCLPEAETGLCNSIGIYCACDGTNVTLSGCAEAATVPVAHAGACPGTDGGF